MMNYSSTLNPSFWLHFWFILFRENVQILAEKTYWNTYWKKYQREMATTGLQLLGFILGVFAWAGMIATCASPEWRKNSVGGTALDQHKRYFFLWNISLCTWKIRFDGLWVQCEQMPNGNTNCESYNVFFIGLPGKIFHPSILKSELIFRGTTNMSCVDDSRDWAWFSGNFIISVGNEVYISGSLKS